MIEPITEHHYAHRHLSVFDSNLNRPRHRWFEFKEGFSAGFVDEAISDVPTRKGKLRILDPFAGSGTTLVAGARHGHHVTGLEVNPFLAFAARAKCVAGKWGAGTFLSALDSVLKAGRYECRSPIEDLSTFSEREGQSRWLFNRSVLRGFTALERALKEHPRFRQPLRLALIASLMDCCNAKRDGKCLRYKPAWQMAGFTSHDLRERFTERARQVLEDVNALPLRDASTTATRVDSRTGLRTLPSGEFDLVVTSPPYLNSFDYSDVYRPELFAGGFVKTNVELRRIRLQTVRSHVQVKWSRPTTQAPEILRSAIAEIRASPNLWDARLPDMIVAYFEDMGVVLAELARVTRTGGKAWIIVSTSAYAGIQIPVDLALADIASCRGWALQGVYVIRQLRAAGQLWAHLKPGAKPPLRESIIVLERQKAPKSE